jgi:hypothetical protein
MGNNIKETDDWFWVEGLINPWELGYTAVEFDVQPSKEDIELLINFALLMPNIDKITKSIWERSMDILIKKILNRYNKEVSKRGVYLVIKDNKFLWGLRPAYSYELNIVKYSHLINTKLNESQDDLDWIRNTEIDPRLPYVGMKFKITDDHETENIIYTITDMTDTHMVINWLDPLDEVYTENFKWHLKHYFDFIDKGEVEIVYENINESQDDLDWIRDIQPSVIRTVGDIRNNLRKPFILVNRKTGKPYKDSDGQPKQYWLDIEGGYNRFNVCFYVGREERCVSYKTHEILANFSEEDDGVFRWVFPDSYITESDELDWIRDIEYPNTITFFIPGQEYYMEKLTHPNSLTRLTFSEHMEDRIADTYDDGRGTLKFGNFFYTPLYIETRLKELGLTLYDLEAKNTITESNFLDDFLPDYNWYDNIDAAIERGTIYTSKNPETLKQILELLEIKFPELVWQTGTKPTQFFPDKYMFGGGQLWIVVPKQDRLYFSISLKDLEKEYKYYKIVEV